MKFVVDAQLPRHLVRELNALGHDAVHTLDLPAGNRTSDADISAFAIKECRAVVTKDSDFVTSFLLHGIPPKLLLISTGNISNEALWRLIAANLPAITKDLSTHNFVELSTSTITVHS